MTSLKQKRFVDTDYFHQHLDSTMVEVEGSYISATDTKIGTITDLEILGNTVQDSENLADIRSLGTDNEDGTYSYEIVTCGKNLVTINNVFIDGHVEKVKLGKLPGANTYMGAKAYYSTFWATFSNGGKFYEW